jgi:hypothetical protein
MRIIKIIILFICLTSIPCFAGEQRTQTDLDLIIMQMFNHAKANDIEALKLMGKDIKKVKNRTLSNAYNLALLIARPSEYKKRFIDNFPIDAAGIMSDLYERIELKQLTPNFLYSFETIGQYAEEGNRIAIEKVLKGHIHSDGAVSEIYCNSMNRLYLKQTKETIAALSLLSKKHRMKNYECFEYLSLEGFVDLQDYLKRNQRNVSRKELAVINEIENYQ